MKNYNGSKQYKKNSSKAVLQNVYSNTPTNFMKQINKDRDADINYKNQLNKISKNKIIITTHALKRFNTRINTGKNRLTQNELKNMAFFARYKGIHVFKNQVQYLYKRIPKLKTFIESLKNYSLDNSYADIIYYNNIIWIFKGKHNRTLVTVYGINDEFFRL